MSTHVQRYRFSSLSTLFFGYFTTLLVLAFLGYIIYYFYTWEESRSLSPIFGVIFLSVLTDGLFVMIHLPRKQVKHENLSFDPSKLTVVIACYNGQDIIGETIRQAMTHVPASQILVVSDASTDNTVEVAKSYGVRVHQNERNLNKAFSISAVMHKIYTPYVLILDDDTLIEKTFIPTSLLDEGYSAVAFNVMPVYTGTLVNRLQIFEYRKSMVMGKGLRAGVGAVGNISGAIGLYRTKDLQEQAPIHSGQFGGEDQQRTALVHLKSEGSKGVTYTTATVETLAPDTVKSLLKQRSFRWNLSLPELFVVYLKVLINPRFHFLLKAEKAYQMYLLMTDPLRMLFFWAVFAYPVQAGLLYLFYTAFCMAIWLKLGRKDPFWIVLIYPLYSSVESICRFVAHFYWFKIKYQYLFQHKHHRRVPKRKLLVEYSLVGVLLTGLWSMSATSLQRAVPYIYMPEYWYLQEFEPQVLGASNSSTDDEPLGPELPAGHGGAETDSRQYSILLEKGDGRFRIAHKAITQYVSHHNITLTDRQFRIAEYALQAELTVPEIYEPNVYIEVSEQTIKNQMPWLNQNISYQNQ